MQRNTFAQRTSCQLLLVNLQHVCDVGCCWVDDKAYTKAVGARSADVRLLASIVSELSAVPWVFVKRIEATTVRYGCILRLPTLVVISHRGTHMISAYTSEKDPLRTNSTKTAAGHTENKATIRTRRNHPYDQYVLPVSTIRKASTGMVHQGPRSLT